MLSSIVNTININIMLKIMLGWRDNTQIMQDENDTSTPVPIGPYQLINILSLSFFE